MAVSLTLHHTAFLQVLFVIAMCDKGQANHINFYNVIPPVDATPFPKSFKCFTCEHASDNYNCNRWAEDKWCPQNTQFCMTVHHFTSHGKTKFVTKRCAGRDDCHAVGCQHHRDTGHTECTSCCEGMVCNVDVPTNHSNAVFAKRQADSSSAPRNWSWRTPTLVALMVTLLVLL